VKFLFNGVEVVELVQNRLAGKSQFMKAFQNGSIHGGEWFKIGFEWGRIIMALFLCEGKKIGGERETRGH
jgi:hypothetical protein